MQIGITSTFPSTLKRTDFPSITGNPASGPIDPKPRIAVPSETIAQYFLKLYSLQSFYVSFFRFFYEK